MSNTKRGSEEPATRGLNTHKKAASSQELDGGQTPYVLDIRYFLYTISSLSDVQICLPLPCSVHKASMDSGIDLCKSTVFNPNIFVNLQGYMYHRSNPHRYYGDFEKGEDPAQFVPFNRLSFHVP